MREYFNVNSLMFERELADPLYQDKSGLISHMNKIIGTNRAFICVTRPRRFGKSLAYHMLNAYYSKGAKSKRLFIERKVAQEAILKVVTPKDRKLQILPLKEIELQREQTLKELKKRYSDWDDETFKELISISIENYTTHLNKYDVISVDFNDLYADYCSYLKDFEQDLILCKDFKIFNNNLTRFLEQRLIKAKKPLINLTSIQEIIENIEPIDLIQFLQRTLVKSVVAYYKDELEQANEKDLHEVIKELAIKKNLRFIVLIDEWDFIFREKPFANDQKLKESYVEFLRSMFKSSSTAKYIDLAYITGILPIEKYNSESSLNNFIEYSMLNPRDLYEYYGFTKEEVKQICSTDQQKFEKISNWYDGYLLNGQHIYNPYSVVNAIASNSINCYWTKTSASSIVFDFVFGVTPLIEQNTHQDLTNVVQDAIMQLLIDQTIPANLTSFSGNLNNISSIDHLFSLMICLGYLTFVCEGDDPYVGYVKIPNQEIKLALKEELLNHPYAKGHRNKTIELSKLSQEAFYAIINEDPTTVSRIIDLIHNNSVEFIPINEYNNEAVFRLALQFLLFFATVDHYRQEVEALTGLGYADLLYIPYRVQELHPPMIIEFKIKQSCEKAIEQIRAKNYKQKIRLEFSSIPIYYIGISYDPKTKKHLCAIEKDLP